MQISFIETILFVKDQQVSRDFYQMIFNQAPVLDVPGMTEFKLGEFFKLGLMPESGIRKILSDKTPDPAEGNGIPRCEIYLYVDDVDAAYDNAMKADAKLISSPEDRDWGDRVCYFADPDGHILAFAERILGN